MTSLCINDETASLRKVIIGLGAPYQRDKEKVAAEMSEFPLVPNTSRRDEVLALTYPVESDLIDEYAGFQKTLENYGIEVLLADPQAAYSFDYTCPRDIGFVIGDQFFIANMAVSSRSEEIKTVAHHLSGIEPQKIIQPPAGCLLEGGDVILLNRDTVLVGMHQRSDMGGYEFLDQILSPQGYQVIPVRHRQLHLDCCLNPLGLGHLLIHIESLESKSKEFWTAIEPFSWIEVDDAEREYLATNILSINPETVIARNHPACARVNQQLENAGYKVEAITFDGVPATGGSFRCASLVLNRDE